MDDLGAIEEEELFTMHGNSESIILSGIKSVEPATPKKSEEDASIT